MGAGRSVRRGSGGPCGWRESSGASGGGDRGHCSEAVAPCRPYTAGRRGASSGWRPGGVSRESPESPPERSGGRTFRIAAENDTPSGGCFPHHFAGIP